MSSALDEDTRRALDEGRETAGAVLRSAQKDLQKVFIVFLIGFLGTFYALRLYVWETLKAITKAQMQDSTRDSVDIIAQTPFDVILLQAKIGLLVGLIMAIPPFLYFARDPLRERGLWPQTPVARWKLAVVGLLTTILFAAGTAYGYGLFFPLMFNFLAENALSVGFETQWSIVMWTEFIVLLSVSFGLAAQLPLAMTALAYAEIVPYETFRDRWRYAVAGIFVFGALFSPPDPFTQIMWALPLLVLYGFSLYLTKIVVTAKRGKEQVSLGRAVKAHWNVVLGVVVLAVAAVYYLFRSGASSYVGREVLPNLPYVGDEIGRLGPISSLLGLPRPVAIAAVGLAGGLVLGVLALMVLVYRELDPSVGGQYGRPAAIDVGELDADGVRAAPSEAFESMTEEVALAHASEALEADDHETAQAILDRYDEAHEGESPSESAAETAEVAAAPSAFEMPDGLLSVFGYGVRRVYWRRRLGKVWHLFAGVGVAAAAATYYALWLSDYGRYVARFGDRYLLDAVPLSYRTDAILFLRRFPPDVGFTQTEVIAVSAIVGLLAVAPIVLLFILAAVWQAGRDPTAIDLETLSTAELRDAPQSLYANLSENQAMGYADRAMAAGDEERAQVIIDRWDESQAPEPEPESDPEPGSVGDRATRASGTFVDELTEGERDEDDIGGYYSDIAFILESLTSKSFRIIGTFMTVLGVTFYWLYSGGIGAVREDFLGRMPSEVRGEELNIITLHPVEALIFEVKFSTLIAAVAVLPMVAYYAWPALRERNLVLGHRRVIFGWTAILLAGLFGGFALGYTTIAPGIISYLVNDAVAADMVISYRISDFFWLIFYTTFGIGLLADVPVFMILLNTAGVPYRAMRDRWREVTVGILTFAALFTPADVTTMFLVTIPLMVVYGTGLVVLFVLTLGGRRDLRSWLGRSREEPATAEA